MSSPVRPAAPTGLISVSYTHLEYERTRSGQIVEQVIRPTGLLDPRIEVRPVEGQIDVYKRQALAGVGIELLDHLVFVDGDMVSMRDSGMMK